VRVSALRWAQKAARHGLELGSDEGWANGVDDDADECRSEGWLDGCKLDRVDGCSTAASSAETTAPSLAGSTAVTTA